MKSIERRQAYIRLKNKQHSSITDVHKYQHRLKWLIRYHVLLTELEVAEIKRCVQRAIRDEKG